MSDYIIYASCALIYHPQDKNLILGVSRKDDHDDWGLPGGKIDPGETALEAVIRETKEETNLDVVHAAFVFETIARDNLMVPTFECSIQDFSIMKSSEHEGLVRWVTREELLKGSFGDYNEKLFKHIDNIHRAAIYASMIN